MAGHIIYAYIIIVLLAFVSKGKKGLLLSFVVLIWLFSFRSEDIPDTVNYTMMYENPLTRLEVNEIGFLGLGMAFKNVTGADFVGFSLAIISFCIIVWTIVTKKIIGNDSYLLFCLLLFLSFHGFFYYGIVVRNALSETLLYIGVSYYVLSEKKKAIWIYILVVFLGTLIHRSAATYILLLPFLKMKIHDKIYLSFYFVCIFIWLVIGTGIAKPIVDLFQRIEMFSKLENYSHSAEASPSILSLQILSNLLLSYFAIINRRFIKPHYSNTYNCFLNINMAGLLSLSLLWSIPTSYRFYNMFFFFNFVILYIMIFHNKKSSNLSRNKVLALVVSMLFFIILIHSFDFMLLY